MAVQVLEVLGRLKIANLSTTLRIASMILYVVSP